MSIEGDFEFKGFWGASILRPYVEYSKKGIHYCIYCGGLSDTREHVPSKVFLNRPFPDDLPTLPACQKCNNGFSADELYTNTYIECTKSIYENGNLDSIEIESNDRKEIKEAKQAVKSSYIIGCFKEDDRIIRILYKLALGHIAYELFECYNIECYNNGIDVSIKYVFKYSIDKESWLSLDTIELLDDEFLPEVGSRSFRNIFVLESAIKSIDKKNSAVVQNIVMMWSDIQKGTYKYIALFRKKETIVKMIIRDFLYAEVKIRREF